MINVQAQPYVTILAVDPDNAFRYLEIRGVVDEITREGVSEYINELSLLYTGKADFYQGAPQAFRELDLEHRVIFKIKPLKVVTPEQVMQRESEKYTALLTQAAVA